MRRIIIGDVHGCLNELQALVAKVGYRQGNDHIIFVGDLLDRGPYPVATVAYAMEIGSFLVRGNHEDNALRWLAYEDRVRTEPGFKNPMDVQPVRRERRPAKSGAWKLTEGDLDLRRKRQEARVAKGLPAVAERTVRQPQPPPRSIPDERKAEWRAITEEQRRWLNSSVYVDLSPEWYVVHAGLEARDFGEQDPDRIMRLRYVFPETGHMAPSPSGTLDQPPGSVWWMEVWPGPMNVIYGHAVHSLSEPRIDVRQTPTGVVRCFGIDTGCCYGGRLTAMVFEDTEMKTEPTFVQVESEQPRIHLPPGVPS